MGENAKPAVPQLRKGLANQHAWMRIASAEAIWKIDKDSSRALPVIHPFLKHHEKEYRVRVINLLGEMETAAKPMQQELIALLKDREAEVRAAAAEALGRQAMEAKTATGELSKRLEDDDAWVRVVSAEALHRIGAPIEKAVDVLVAVLRDKGADKDQRVRAANVLGEIGPPARKAVPDLKAARKDAPEDLQNAAAEALKKIDPEAAEKAGAK
jgi:HEAT repeat protein